MNIIRMRKILLFLMCISIFGYSQDHRKSINHEKPKIVVGIVVDQMRYDYIYRFWDDFGQDGFKRLINEGHFFRNAQFGYVPTYTGPGHASIYTGTTPSSHGIIANSWYDKSSGKNMYCAQDDEMRTIGDTSSSGNMSPHNMLTTTFADELKLFHDGKVIGISLKDRGAILPAGHSADAAYWMNNDGKWISSSYYMDKLPDWLLKINKNNPAANYMEGKIWRVKNEFTHNLNEMYLISGGSAIKTTPLGNTILKDLAIEILKEERLGKRNTTDILTISFSSTDYIGHKYGPHAGEIKDTYIKLDRDIAQLLQVIDSEIGFENTILFLTADHGVVSEPNELLERNIPAGYFESSIMIESLKSHLDQNFGRQDWIKNYSNNNLYLNHDIINTHNLSLQKIQQVCADFLLNFDGVKNTFTSTQMHNNEYQNSFYSLIQRGYNQKRSGDVIIVLQTGWISIYWEKGGTTHGSSYSYDTHVPLIFWGGKILHGKTDRLINIRDIAPTISMILGTSFPNGCTGNPIVEITE